MIQQNLKNLTLRELPEKKNEWQFMICFVICPLRSVTS